MPWTREVSRRRCRQSPTELNSTIERVDGVAALPGVGRRVQLGALEDDVDVLGHERPARRVAAVARVVHQGRVEAGEEPVLDHLGLAAATLLGRRPEEDDLAGQLVGDRREGDRGADARRGHRVVTAAMAEAGQRVVLGEDPDPRAVAAASPAPDRADRGREAAGGVLHLVAVSRERFRDPCRRRGAPRTPAPGPRGSGATARGSPRGIPRPRPRDGP